MSQGINEVLGEFIEIYKSEPCLWKIKSSDYHDRDKKDAAYRKLVLKLKEIDPDANVNVVKKKINNLRSNVRKEKKKIDSSMKSGASTDNVYKPSLWYFNLFDFINDQDNARSTVSNFSPEDDNDEVNFDASCPEENYLTPNVSEEEERNRINVHRRLKFHDLGPVRRRNPMMICQLKYCPLFVIISNNPNHNLTVASSWEEQ
ncbi:uncharacterized protein [Macrobrachium rosenbergii]|uniref:uncharacterized protein n=1 Tax=Macrobrachium rosenbergii TaxID=79674 RepID=UPI0034D49D71